jgi:prophage regulatory protein
MNSKSIATDPACADEALLRIETVMEMTGKSRNHLYLSMRKGEFPRPVKIGERASAWVRGEVQRWIADRIAERDALSGGAVA